jgi:hypothetical protein
MPSEGTGWKRQSPRTPPWTDTRTASPPSRSRATAAVQHPLDADTRHGHRCREKCEPERVLRRTREGTSAAAELQLRELAGASSGSRTDLKPRPGAASRRWTRPVRGMTPTSPTATAAPAGASAESGERIAAAQGAQSSRGSATPSPLQLSRELAATGGGHARLRPVASVQRRPCRYQHHARHHLPR